jgi:enamine deaminase RidA (YjgF/YER057c/UK114 family)
MTADQRLEQLGIELPVAPSPLGEYVALKQSGPLVFLSGMLPLVDGKPMFTGRVPKERAREAARAATLNALAVLRRHLGGLDKLRGVVRIAVYIAARPDFKEHAFIADGCSELLNQVFPDSGKHARLAFGVTSLPLGMPVELELILEIGDG